MDKSPAERLMKSITMISAVCTAASVCLYWLNGGAVFMSIAITAATFLYHFLMRLMAGLAVKSLIKRTLNYKSKWFSLRKWEPEFYKKIKIKQWKNKLPTYYPKNFSLKNHTVQELLQTMCVSEIAHESMIILSFAPLILSVWFGSFGVFLITSICAGAIDTIFVMVQRYNRNRLVKITKNKTQNQRFSSR